jgi:hypothetical protein
VDNTGRRTHRHLPVSFLASPRIFVGPVEKAETLISKPVGTKKIELNMERQTNPGDGTNCAWQCPFRIQPDKRIDFILDK